MEIVIAAAILAAAYLYGKQGSTPVPVVPPSVPITPATLVSGGYTAPPDSIGNFGVTVSAAAATGAQSPSIPLPTVLPWASPTWIGGVAGTAGSGGNPFGGVVRPGVSLGTATTVVGPTFINSAPGSSAPKLTSAIRPVIA